MGLSATKRSDGDELRNLNERYRLPRVMKSSFLNSSCHFSTRPAAAGCWFTLGGSSDIKSGCNPGSSIGNRSLAMAGSSFVCFLQAIAFCGLHPKREDLIVPRVGTETFLS